MKTEIYHADADFAPIGRRLAAGGLVAFPTETVYGLGASALNERAVEEIFRVKNRPQDNPLIAHVDGTEMLPLCARSVSDAARRLFDAFWPGPLTVILPKADGIANAVTAGGDTVAVRCPDHPVARALICAAGVPVVAPSANLSGKPSPTDFAATFQDLNGKVPMIIDGGTCRVGVESTVVLPQGEALRILRPGAVTPEMLAPFAKEIIIDKNITHPVAAGEKVLSPGMKHRHYAPKAPLTIIRGEKSDVLAFLAAHQDDQTGILCFEGEMSGKNVVYYGKEDDDLSQSRALFHALRAFDEMNVTQIYAREPRHNGVGLAVYNRLLRAASFEIKEVSP